MSTTTRALSVALQANVPILVEGYPGTGKTAFFNSLSKLLDAHLETLIGSLIDPTEACGWPKEIDGVLRMIPTRWAHNFVKECSNGRMGIFFADELNTAPVSVQAALLRVFNERVVGEVVLPSSVSCVAAVNPPECSAGGEPLSPPLANRFCHLSWAPTAKEWATGTRNGFAAPDITRLPQGWESLVQLHMTTIAGYIETKKPHALLAVPKDATAQGKAWPSNRTWTMAGRLMAAAGEDQHVREMLLAGCIGDGHAIEFLTWHRELDLPDIEEALAKPGKIKLPFDRPDALYTFLTGVAQAVITHHTEERSVAAMTILNWCATKGHADVACSALKALIGKWGELYHKGDTYPKALVKEIEALGPGKTRFDGLFESLRSKAAA